MSPLRKLTMIGPAALALALTTLPATAEDAGADSNDPTYSAISLSSVTTDYDNLDNAVNLGFTMGVAFPPLGNKLAAEIDISSTIIPGENSGGQGLTGGNGGGGGGNENPLLGGMDGGNDSNDESNSGNRTRGNEDLRINSIGLFLSGRTPGTLYAMGRAGYRFVESTIDEINDESTGAAFSIGGGYRYSGDGTIELSYTQYTDDAAYLSLVINY